MATHSTPDDTALEMVQLCQAFKEAKAKIESLEGLERQIGLASLRLEAVAAYKQLTSTGTTISHDAAQPLKELVSTLTGGETVEKGIGVVDRQAQALATTTLATMSNTVFLGKAVPAGLVALVGVIAIATDALKYLGASVFLLVVGSTAALRMLLQGAKPLAEAGQEAFVESWNWASNLGQQSDAALAEARSRTEALWAKATRAAWRGERFTDKARSRAYAFVGISWFLVIAGIVMVVMGAVEASQAREASRLRYY